MFTQSLLCKAIKDGLLDKVIYSNKTFGGNVRSATTSLGECIPAKPGFKSYCRYVSIRSYEWQYGTVAIYKISNAKIGISTTDNTAKQFFTGTGTYTGTFTGVIYTTPDVNQAINLYATGTDSGSVFGCQGYMEVGYVISRDFDETFKPQTVSGLGEVNNPISFGRLPNNKRWDGGLLDGVGGLPLEFVEKFSVSSSNNRQPSGKTYNYDIFVICKGDDIATNFNVASYYNGYTYPGGSSDVSNFGISSGFVKAGIPFGTVKIGGVQVRTWTYYIYKLNLPQ